MTLLDVVQAFPARNQVLKVYPNRASLCSLVCKMREAKKNCPLFCKKSCPDRESNPSLRGHNTTSSPLDHQGIQLAFADLLSG